jgi:hypothetical protein
LKVQLFLGAPHVSLLRPPFLSLFLAGFCSTPVENPGVLLKPVWNHFSSINKQQSVSFVMEVSYDKGFTFFLKNV